MPNVIRLLGALLLATSAGAQLAPDTLPLRDLSAFKSPPSTWRADNGVLRGQGDLATTWEHGNLDLTLDAMVPSGGSVSVLLAGRHEIRLTDGHGAGIVGMRPRFDASRAAGLWQTLAVQYRTSPSGAWFARVELNGATIHENVRVPGATTPGALGLRATGGSAAFRKVRFKRYGGERMQLAGLRYRAWQGEFASLDSAMRGAPAREGVADGITSRLSGATDKFAVAVDGTFRVPVAGTYVFDLGFDWVDDDPQFKGTVIGGGTVTIDGKEVVKHPGRLPNATGSVALTPGEHTIAVRYYKNRPWTNRFDATLYAEGPGVERQALHAARTPDLPGVILVDAETGPVVQRGFVRLGDDKRTHAAAVGDPSGTHYALDLATGALLEVWRGPFADATDMWHDRGNDQVLRPTGSVLTLSGAPSLATLPHDAAPWPGAAEAYVPQGYALDSLGRPTFLARLGDVQVEDRLQPSTSGLRRELHLRGNASRLFVRLAAAPNVTRLADGRYLIGDATYYVSTTSEATVRSVAGGQELVVPVRFSNGDARVAYTIQW